MVSQLEEPIAIVGSGCRFPGGVTSSSALLKLLENPRDVSQEIPQDRFDVTGFYHPDGSHHGTTNVRRSYFMQDNPRKFDAGFFNISPHEADSMDPQQRLLLEVVYEALEEGGHPIEGLRGSDTAVYVGTMGVDYNDTLLRDLNTIPVYFATGTNRAVISNRISYYFDWHGPSMTIDTACSSSLIAVHQAVQALRTGESRVALACGTQVILGPEVFVFESKMKMLSPIGIAAIVLKRLTDAIADGDHIDCLIRGTGTNQDGHSTGLTVPSSEAQVALIRQTYARAGLDLEDTRDRPQFFEAHGTGTKVGDPKEAAAIHECFGQRINDDNAPLYVGSVKTVIGHTEGAAGLAGLLKGSGIIQNGLIPPNLLFNSLNPAIEPYYRGLHVPTRLIPWPNLPQGVPRRVSVNSFGFGGSNAHAILEEYCDSSASPRDIERGACIPYIPFVFSAASETSLVSQLQAYSNYLKSEDTINISDLAWTLQSRRSQLPIKAAFSALTMDDLTSKIDVKLAEAKENPTAKVGVSSSSKLASRRILAVFTGQGAQWAAMGEHLIRTSEFTLPLSDRPHWNLQDEMLAGADTSRISEAELSQPLCTALQIILVKLLHAAAIEFTAVVGHSSGEIAAAYAAGFISETDAIRIAYYRGFHARLARNSYTGAMLAVGTSCEDAQDLINLRAFKGRLAIAAHNSAASVTLSGDADAIKFARPLKLIRDRKRIEGIYWRNNMTHAVLFADAIGPHPALKGPIIQNISDILPTALPYIGVLNALGAIWTHTGTNSVDFQSFDKIISSRTAGDAPQSKLVVGLPAYPWSHGRAFWHEKQPFHELLGVLSPDSTPRDMRWSNVLKLSEVPWLNGHQLQGQPVFPAAGYVALALEASRSLTSGKAVKLFEVNDLHILKAITFEEDVDSGIETLVTLTAIMNSDQQDNNYSNQKTTVVADFSCYSPSPAGAEPEMELMASGTVKIVFGTPMATTLSCTPLNVSNMSTVDTDRFYSSLSKLGYGYNGPFRGMSSLKRRFNQSSVLVSTFPSTDADSPSYMVHPTWLDVAFQASMLAYSAPGDERLWSLHVPISIRTIRVNPEVCASLPTSASQLPVCAVLNEAESFSASMEVFGEDGQLGMVQIEDLTIKPFAPATEADDRHIFTSTKWDFASPDGASIVHDVRPSSDETELAIACDRVSYHFVRKWKAEITTEEWTSHQQHFSHLRDYVDHTLSTAATGKHPFIRGEWLEDSTEVIQALINRYWDNVDIKLISAVGENIPAAVRGQTTILEHMLADNMLDDFYKKGLGFARYNSFMASMMKQLVHRYPHANILEIGAGTGGATKSTLQKIGNTMSSYTYTDVSVGFFERATELFRQYSHKMTFKMLDIEKNPTSQGFEPHSYDIVIASNVLHATTSLQNTLENTRQLLRPGGYLMLLELTNNSPIRLSTIMGGLPGWWLGVDDGRKYAPTTTPGVWHDTLRKAGFSGIDTITPEIDILPWPFSIMAAQAVDDRVNFLRRPLSQSASSASIYIESLVILGTSTLATARIAEGLVDSLGRFCAKITILCGLPTEDETLSLHPRSTFVNLVDLDAPIFQDITAEKMDGLKRLSEFAKQILWVTSGAQSKEPYHMASISFGRAMSHETEHISWSYLDISDSESNATNVIAEYLLRQCALNGWKPGGDGRVAGSLLWSQEPEASIRRGQLMIPRLITNVAQNRRLNSSKRPIRKNVTISSSTISMTSSSDSSPRLVEEVIPAALTDTQRVVKVVSSSLKALHIIGDAFLFVAIGKDASTNHSVIVLSTTNSSEITPIAGVPALTVEAIELTESLLVVIASHLFATALVENIPSMTTILVHCSSQDRVLAAALSYEAATKSIRLVFTCDAECMESTQDQDAAWIKLKTHASMHSIRMMLLPARPTYFLDLTQQPGTDPSDLSFTIALAMSPGYKPALAAKLGDAVSKARMIGMLSNPSQYFQNLVIQLDQIHKTSNNQAATSVIHWPLSGEVEIQVSPLDARRLFSKDKTYLLVGLTGEIGRSICEWMISNGAGCVCLTSRSPKINEQWTKSMESMEAIVRVFSMDVTDKQSVKAVVDNIRKSCPPIAGVANGAMVLHDSLFSSMSLNTMLEVLGPKVDGTNNLDQVFFDDELDFFVLFSSSACVVGNSGQTNYAAANGYLNSLARQRRSRGLAASTVDIGRVAGLGYVEKAGQAVISQLTRFGLMTISESELHHIFAETILAGYLDAKNEYGNSDPVVTTGIRMIRDDEEIRGPWFENPRFSHCIIDTKNIQSDTIKNVKNTTLPVSEQLSRVTRVEQAQQVLRGEQEARRPIISQVQLAPVKRQASESLSESEYSLIEKSTPSPGFEPIESTLTRQSSTSSSKSFDDTTSPNTTPLPPLVASSDDIATKFVKSVELSFGQSRFWFLQHLLEDKTTSNVAFYYHIAGNLRIGDMERAVRIVAARHEALRTCFIEDPTEADQAYQRHKTIESKEDVAAEYSKLMTHVFDLANGKTIKLILLSFYHHIMMDGAYNGQYLGAPPQQFPDSSVAQREAFDSGEMNAELQHWQRMFPDDEQPPVLPLLSMAKTSSRTAMKIFEVHQVGCRIDAGIVARIKTLSKAQRSTPFHFYLAAYQAMLFSFSDAQALTIGIADANRNDSDVIGSIGFFLNLLPLRFPRQSDQRFTDAIAQARNTAYAALGNSRLPFDVLLRELNVDRSLLYSPFFQAFFDYRQGAQEKHAWGDCQFEFQEAHPGRTAYDVTLDITDNAIDGLVMIRTQKSLYDLTAANLLLETYIHFVDILSRDASLTMNTMPLSSARQLTHAVEVGRGRRLVSNWPETLPHRVDQMVQQNGAKTALVDGVGNTFTYSAMANRIEAISERLQDAGIGPGSRVCSMLAIMRVGAVYVPLDLRNPMPRLAIVANDCQPEAILADTTTLSKTQELNAPYAVVIDVSSVLPKPSTRIANCARPDSRAAILYTSGSTGIPKGIVVTHSGLRNEIEGYTKRWKLGAERVLQQSSFTFNHSSDQIYTGLVNGGMVYIVPESDRGDPYEVTKIVQQNFLTYTKATPSEYSLWMQYGAGNLQLATHWRFAFGGGEPLTSSILQRFADLDLPQLRVFNSYGPTEISISSTKMEIQYRLKEAVQDNPIPCGYSLPNYHTYIVDEQLKPLPIGMPGEICIGGAGVSLGYLNNQELTSQHFVTNPFASPNDIANGWTRMYRTGDIGHLQGDGAMVFHNRKAGDNQVKIRGLRIELSDIESNIVVAAGGVLTEAVVTLREGDPDFLAAFVVFAAQYDSARMDGFLENLLSQLPLPQYMIPVVAIPLDRLPITNHSKVDRKAIQSMSLPRRAPRAKDDGNLSETMLLLKQVWQDVLGNTELGFVVTSSTSFFLVGGNSLLVIRLQSRIRKVFNVVVRLVVLLSANTLGEMARKIEESVSVDLIDWEKETAVPSIPGILENINKDYANQEARQTVLITGGTSYLAKYILPMLDANPDIAAIHCVAVRETPSDKPRKIFASSKIVSHSGDLSTPLLGLSKDVFYALSSQVNIILHIGATRSFWDNYHALRSSNVDATKELAKLAAPRRIPIHYISTAAVLPRATGTVVAESAAINVPPRDGTNGYVASRWASERILESCTTELGIPTFVYRFLPSTAQSTPERVLDEWLHFVDASRLIPDMTGWEGRIDMIPAKTAANWLCDSMLSYKVQSPSTWLI
ncbi:lovastatin nonaketide synthase [Xylaria telfairii]|nr:lovastatin nonaketide synthase [Xylaria telfairii]